MTNADELVWYEADGTRHVVGRPDSEAVEPGPAPAESVEPTAAAAEPVPVQPASAESTEPEARSVAEAGPESAPEPAEATEAEAEPSPEPAEGTEAEAQPSPEPAEGTEAEAQPSPEPAEGEAVADDKPEEPSALRGMLRSLLLGAAAAIATGVIVGILSLVSTGSRPQTSEIDQTTGTSDPAPTPAGSTVPVEQIDLSPPASVDQPE